MPGRLVLSRKVGDSIIIGDEIEVTVLELRDGQVKLGIIAPRSVKVNRLEVWRRIMKERQDEARAAGRELPDRRTPSERLDGEAA